MSSDRLGYGKPPPWTQFRAGQSGNPKGRPKKTASTTTQKSIMANFRSSASDDVLREILSEPLTATDKNGKLKTISKFHALQIAQLKTALKGSAHAQQALIKEARALEQRDAEREAAEEAEERAIDARLYATMVARKKDRARMWAEAMANGTEPQEPWPHPDDILINHKRQTWYIRGPNSSVDTDFAEYCRSARDYYFAEEIVALRGKSKFSKMMARFYMILVFYFNALLPLRWQIKPDDLEILLTVLLQTPLKIMKDYANDKAEKMQMQSINLPPLDRKAKREAYKFSNMALKPLLKHNGYRSLAELETSI
jgi:Family of unknown function (DUF5681)